MVGINFVRGRKDSRIVGEVHATTDDDDAVGRADIEKSVDGKGSDKASIEAMEDRELADRPDKVTEDASAGVQKAEAAALVWSQQAVYGIYAWIWVCFFMLALQSSIGNNVIYYAYSNFSSAPEIATAGILANIVGGVLKLPIAKVLNLWGRAEGLLVFTAVYLLGIVVIATCDGPNGYAAGYVLYWVGYDALYLILDVFMADTSGLRNRAFAFGFASTPFICTAFTGPLAAQSFLQMTTWRWAYGAFAIIMPFVFLPLAAVFKFYENKAVKAGIIQRTPSGRSLSENLAYNFVEFDVIGVLLLMAAFLLFLLPFSMQTYNLATYNSATFIAMVVVGVLLFFVFAAWERWYAPVQFIRWEIFRQPTMLGACCLAAVLYFSFYCWDLYYYYFVYVVFDLGVSDTGYMTQIYNIGSCFWSVVFGLYVRYTHHFKYACLLFGLPLMFLGAGLLVHFRGSSQGLAGVIGAQVCIAIAGGTLVIGEDMAGMAAAGHDGVAMVLSLLSLAASVGGAIGYAVAAAIYASTFPAALQSALPNDTASDWQTIYNGGYIAQTAYPVGSATRDAIDYAWGQSQMYGAIAATCILVLAIPCIMVWKNYRVDRQQNKGTML